MSLVRIKHAKLLTVIVIFLFVLLSIILYPEIEYKHKANRETSKHSLLDSNYNISSKIDSNQKLKSPYPPSNYLIGVTWNYSDTLRFASGSDLWPLTWADDDKMYGAWGDGGGFGGTNRLGRVSIGVAKIKGAPANPDAENINGGVNSENNPTWKRPNSGKIISLAAIDGVLWGIYIDQKIPQSVKFIYSKNHGKTWKESYTWGFNNKLFFPGVIIQYGKNYTDNSDGFVYLYGWDFSQSVSSMKLARIPRDSIYYQKSWKFFTGMGKDSIPIWSAQFNKAVYGFIDSSATKDGGIGNILYIKKMNRFIMSEFHGKYSGGDGDARSVGFFESRFPWGPWKTIYYSNNFYNLPPAESMVSFKIAPKVPNWLSSDGLSFTIVWSGRHWYDAFNVITGKFLTRESKK